MIKLFRKQHTGRFFSFAQCSPSLFLVTQWPSTLCSARLLSNFGNLEVRRIGPLTRGPVCSILYLRCSATSLVRRAHSQLGESTDSQPERHLSRRRLLRPSAEQPCKATICGCVCYCMCASMLFFALARCCKCVRLNLWVIPSLDPQFWFFLAPNQASVVRNVARLFAHPPSPVATRRISLPAWRKQFSHRFRLPGAMRPAAGTVASVATLLTSQRWGCSSLHAIRFPGPNCRPRSVGVHPPRRTRVMQPLGSTENVVPPCF